MQEPALQNNPPPSSFTHDFNMYIAFFFLLNSTFTFVYSLFDVHSSNRRPLSTNLISHMNCFERVYQKTPEFWKFKKRLLHSQTACNPLQLKIYMWVYCQTAHKGHGCMHWGTFQEFSSQSRPVWVWRGFITLLSRATPRAKAVQPAQTTSQATYTAYLLPSFSWFHCSIDRFMILSLLSRQIHYLIDDMIILTNCVAWYGAYTETLNIELFTYKTLRFSKNCELRHGWPVYNFWGITRPRSLFFTWLFDRWTLQQILRRSIPKTRNSRKIASGRFFHSGSQM